jgi:hypothetical protein
VKFDPEVYRVLAKFIVESTSAFSIVEKTSFRNLCTYMNAATPTVSRRTVQRDILKLQDEIRPQLKNRFDNQIQTGGNINLTYDAWSSMDRTSYLGVTAHFLDCDFQMHNVVIGFKRLLGSHDAQNLASVIVAVCEEWEIEKNTRCITTDNAPIVFFPTNPLFLFATTYLSS